VVKVKFTDKQKRVLRRLAEGAKIKAYTPAHGRQCFESNEDGLRGVLYLTLTMRSLRDKGVAGDTGADPVNVNISSMREYKPRKEAATK
jgi:hypothetical protein